MTSNHPEARTRHRLLRFGPSPQSDDDPRIKRAGARGRYGFNLAGRHAGVYGGFPPLLQSLLFWVFAALVVHVCQQLVDHTAYSVDPSSRRISASHAPLCIGSIVWALDVVGLFLYNELSHHVLELVPALSGWSSWW